MTPTLEQCLSDLERRLDDSVESELNSRWRAFALGQSRDRFFMPRRPAKNPPAFEWPKTTINASLKDFDLMALNQYWTCSRSLESADARILMVRANFGTPIIPTLFGAELFIMPEETNTLPASHALPGEADAMRRMLDAGEPSLDQPYFQRVLEMGRRYRAIHERFPKIARWVKVFHPDTQGPMDILEMLWGSSFFMALYDEPQLVHDCLKLITRAYIRVLREWEKIWPLNEDGITWHWGMAYRGSIMLRDDSAMNLSTEMFDEFVRPYDQALLDEFGGGAMHSCGKIDHFLEAASTLRGLSGFNMGQPYLNPIDTILRCLVDRGITLLDFDVDMAEKALADGRDFRGLACNVNRSGT
jgi:hypothetical protein